MFYSHRRKGINIKYLGSNRSNIIKKQARYFRSTDCVYDLPLTGVSGIMGINQRNQITSLDLKRKKVVTVLCFDSRSRVLVHLRDFEAPVYPLHFAFISGQIRIGELPITAGCRELSEELRKKTKITYLGVIKLSKEARTVHVFRANVNDHRLRCFEGVGVKWVSSKCLLKRKMPWNRRRSYPIAKPYLIWPRLYRLIVSNAHRPHSSSTPFIQVPMSL